MSKVDNKDNLEEVKTNISISDRLKAATKRQWIKFSIMTVLCLLFVLWTSYMGVLLLIFLFFDSYILKFIPWSFWKKSKNNSFRKIMEWVDAIGFALIAVWVINTFFFQNYQIPSSSLEKSLLVGDFLFVSKMSYGTRSPITPLSFPLAQHTLPIFDCKSYFDKPQVKYQRFAGFGQIERGDIVVFNFPAGDTVAVNQQAVDYYSLMHMDRDGRKGVWSDKAYYGEIVYRPVDRRENYVKRCMGLPGETLEVRDDDVYINGNKVDRPENMELNYYIQTDGTQLSEKIFEDLGVSKDDYLTRYSDEKVSLSSFDPIKSVRSVDDLTAQTLSKEQMYSSDSLYLTQLGFVAKVKNFGLVYNRMPLTQKMVDDLKKKPFILGVVKDKETISKLTMERGASIDFPFYYPISYKTGWMRHAYGPIWIPKKGETIKFDSDVDYKVAAYERAIKNYEGNDFAYRNGKVFINGKQADSYTFEMDYYFMMGDNRHNSADSRSWGFVPEDHVVGSPLFVWLSLDKDKGWLDGKIRWSRIFTSAKKK